MHPSDSDLHWDETVLSAVEILRRAHDLVAFGWCQGADATDAENNALLLERMRGVDNRTARFVCAIALVERAKLLGTFRGSVQGRILHAPRGTGGFGYDPLFFYERYQCTFGEAPLGDKMLVSHRAQALDKMFEFLRLYPRPDGSGL